MKVSRLGSFASVLLVCLIASGCGGKNEPVSSPQPAQNSVGTPFELPNSGFSGVISLNDDPIRAHVKTSYQLKFWDKAAGGSQSSPFHDPSSKGYTVKSRIWMPMPTTPHGGANGRIQPVVDDSSSPPQASGWYVVNGAEFIMAGEWEVHVELWKEGSLVDAVVQKTQVIH